MRTRLGWAMGLGLGLLAVSPSCAGKKSGLMLAVTTDMKAPKDINAVGLTVSTNNVVKYAAIGRVTPDGDVLLPATLAVVEPDDPSATIRIRVVAFQETKTRVLRDVRTSIPSGGKISLLRLPLSFINDKSGSGDIPAAALPAKKNGGAGPTLGAGGGDSDPATALTIFAQTSCKDAEQTVINGECKDAFVDFNSLPEFRPELVGVGDQKDKCFDVKSCFASAIPLGGATSVDKPPTGEACARDTDCPSGQRCLEKVCVAGDTVSPSPAVDAGIGGRIRPQDLRPQNLTLDKAACAISLNGQDPAKLNLALVSRDTGECIRPNECYVPLDSGDGGWKPDGNLIKLPSFVCKLLGDDTKGLRLFASTSCNAKKEENPVCAETVPPPGSGSEGDATLVTPANDASALRDAGPTQPQGGLLFATDRPLALLNDGFNRLALVPFSGPPVLVDPAQMPPSQTPLSAPVGTGADTPQLSPVSPGFVYTSGVGSAQRKSSASGTSFDQVINGLGAGGPIRMATQVGSNLFFATGGGIFTSPVTQPGSNAVRFQIKGGDGGLVPLPVNNVTSIGALVGVPQPLFIFGTSSGQVTVCDTALQICGAANVVPGGGPVTGAAPKPNDPNPLTVGYALSGSSVYIVRVLNTSNFTLDFTPANLGTASPAPHVDGSRTLPRTLVSNNQCLIFGSTSGLSYHTHAGANGVIVPPAAGPILHAVLGQAPGSGVPAVFYSVFAPVSGQTGGGIYWAALPTECGGAAGGGADCMPAGEVCDDANPCCSGLQCVAGTCIKP